MSVRESAKKVNELLDKYARLKAHQIINIYITEDGRYIEIMPHEKIEADIEETEKELKDALKELETALNEKGKIQD